MAKSCDLSFQQRSLFQQGYQRYSPTELKQLEWGLRFTPAMCSLIAAYGLVNQMPLLLFAVAALGIWAFFLPAAHPMDLLYNHVVRHAFGAVKLPENPFQRRLACLSAGLMNIAAGVLFLAGLPLAAYIVGGMLLFLQAIVIFTHFCTLSWMYEGVMRLLGKWQVPVEESHAHSLLKSGALLVDVRSPNEFARESIQGAVNLPLEELDQHVEKFNACTALLFCNSGTRSHIAAEKLRNLGLDAVHNLGALGRARAVASAVA
jgi:rhodanese-related sulfurtransferase